MGSLSNESFEQFLDYLKKAGITISREAELRERLAETQLWHFAFQTLAANGKAIGICFEDHSHGRNQAEIERAFNEFQFPEKTKAIFSANLKH
jgi:CMP-N-acetylneuraminic acid synthetase